MVKTRMREKYSRVLYIIVSLLVAIVLWLYVDNSQGNKMTETFADIPIEFIGAEDTLPNRGLMLAEGQGATLDVTLSGPRTVISGLRRGDVRAQVNLNSVNSVGSWPLTYDLIYPDTVDRSSITLERASRTYITVKAATLYSREIPVSVSVMAPQDDKYMYMGESLVLEPAVLTLRGLAEDVDKVETCRVTVDLTEATGTVSQEFSYELLDAAGNVVDSENIRASDRRILVTAPVYMTKEIPLSVKLKYAAGSREENVITKLEPESITVAGEPASLETIHEIVLGEVDASAYVNDTDIDLEIKLPAGCINLTGDVNRASLSIKYRGLATRSFMVTNISCIGLSGSQRFDPITTFVNVQLRGPAEDLNLVTADDIRIVVDLTEYASTGSYNVSGTVYVDGYSRVGAVGGPWPVACKITS